ncbi:RNA 2',3'-cyclic phosphodiesterase [Candidatus Dojkabacteria bacterium]|uniref:RNA 2',3'-cyclic phosphodiesterase n=1 Tax=Candidatus Dojkabacteria bacterium TaxID=2099670 RepID=A0A955I6Y4_9BACT|nr:RNA 2',3'-cyclic phosphodiesterase [Candidatus Dojkabacteria bacterium]
MFEDNGQYRAFLAVTPTEEIKSELRDINRQFKRYARNFKFVPLDQLHITLQFLGNSVSGHSLGLIQDNLQSMCAEWSEFEVKIDKLNFGFRGQIIATHLYYSLEEDSELNQLTKSIHEATKSLGLMDVNKKKDHGKLINHMTIARVKGHTNRRFTREVKEFIDTLTFPKLKFTISEVKIISSVFKDNTTNYFDLMSLELKKG